MLELLVTQVRTYTTRPRDRAALLLLLLRLPITHASCACAYVSFDCVSALQTDVKSKDSLYLLYEQSDREPDSFSDLELEALIGALRYGALTTDTDM
jgi:hypothetical protein